MTTVVKMQFSPINLIFIKLRVKKIFYSNCKTVLLWLTLLLSGVTTTAKKACQRKTKDRKKLLKESNIRACHVHFTEESFKRHLEVITFRTTTER